jgi:murein DD-endopeptidase MepM/ murein hydrolase activator NlpD
VLRRRSAGPLLLLLVLGLAGAATARDHAATTGSVAHAFAFKVVEPGQAAAGTPFVAAPPSAADSGTAFALSAAPTGVASGAYSAAVQADSSERTGSAEAQSTVTALSLFDGELRADRIVATAQATATARTASGSVDQSSITNLTLGGQPLDVVPNGRIALGDWGYAVTLVRTETAGQAGTNGYHGTIVALDIHLSADHGGLPANTEIQVGYADAAAQASPPPPPATTTVVKPAPRVGRPRKHVKQPKAPEPNLKHPASITKAPPKNVHVKLSPEGYVFPVYGPCSFIDTFGAGRADVGWHHGDDLFAPLGAPILAVADGTVFMVGWNTIGGNRVWLKDEKGNEYYYAHLSAFSTLAVNGAHVKAGTVLGFVGNTGDAQGTPYHLHFEVHPKSLLKMGYDGVVDPTKWLQALVHAQDVAIPQHVAGGPQGPQDTATGTPSSPLPGAVLLQESDISSADGLDPASLRRVFEPAPFEGTITLSGGTPLDRG